MKTQTSNFRSEKNSRKKLTPRHFDLSSMQKSTKSSSKKLSFLKEEVTFSEILLGQISSVFNEVFNSIIQFDPQKQEKLFKKTKKVLYNWKKNPGNNEKFLRKEFKYG